MQPTPSHKKPSIQSNHKRQNSSLQQIPKLKTVQSIRRIITQQNNKTCHNTSTKRKQINTQQDIKKIKVSKDKDKTISKDKSIDKVKGSVINNKSNYIGQIFTPFSPFSPFSPKNKIIHFSNHNQQPNVISKSTLKKVGGNKINKSIKGAKHKNEERITPFIVSCKQTKGKTGDKNSLKRQSTQGHSSSTKLQKPQYIKHQQANPPVKTLQNQVGKAINPSKKPYPKLYHKLKQKTQNSFLSCESTPSQLLTHDIQILQQIGHGTFGLVYKGILKKTLEPIAIKKVHQDHKYKNRQIQIVNMLSGSSFIMCVIGTFITIEDSKDYLNIVMKYYQTDLYQKINQNKINNHQMDNTHIKVYAYQILRGLLFIHGKRICHRDIKPQNLLIDGMTLVLCDFGSAKVLVSDQKNLPYICSRCYRAPQLIFGATKYTNMIDMWSVGCVLLEMITGAPFFIANSSIDHLIQVIKVLGTPTKSQVKQMNPEYDLKDYKFPNIKSKSFSKIFPDADPLLISLLDQIMIYSPKQRLNAAQALVHQYFDQVRQQGFYQQLQKKHKIPDLFDFKPQQMKGNQHLYGQLVPKWYCLNHNTYFSDQQIQRNNTLQFYCD